MQGLRHIASRDKKKTTTTYTSVMNATGSRKGKVADVQHPQILRRQEQEMTLLQEAERWLMCDQDEPLPTGLVDNDSVDPAGFFADILDYVQEGSGQHTGAAAEDDVGRFECTLEELLGASDDTLDDVAYPAPTPTVISSESGPLPVMAECNCNKTENCEICIQQIMLELEASSCGSIVLILF